MLEWLRRGRRASSRRRLLIGILLSLLLIWCLGGLAYWRCVVVGACELGGFAAQDLPNAPPRAPVAWLDDRMLVTGRRPMVFESGRAPPLQAHAPFFRALAEWLTSRLDQLVIIQARYGPGERSETGMNRARWAQSALLEADVPVTAVIAWHQRGESPALDFRVVRLSDLPPVSTLDIGFAPGGALHWTPHAVRVLAAMRQMLAADAGLRVRVGVPESGGLDARERGLAAADQLVRLGFPGRRVDIAGRTGQAAGSALTVALVRESEENADES